MSLPPGARNVRRVGGGDINEAFHVTLADGADAFVKTRTDASPGEYKVEATGLEWLAEPGALRTPRVLGIDERYLVLEWISPGTLSSAGAEELGRGLARTHAAGATHFGAPSRGTFGSLRLSNDATADWPSFYAERRLRPLAALARDRGALSDTGVRAVEAVCERMSELTGPAEPPARLHGDLWSGNVMADAHGRPWLIDPSAYGGHREVDLAMLRLFGSPNDRVFGAYEEVAPLAEGWRDRVALYQLLPLLVHALLFGGSYRSAAEQAALRYGR
ncbi:MAG TPA: fructosamine kinase family protein [Solirubrobacteraceae bacterium]|jgi:fructosamine-3-kinase